MDRPLLLKPVDMKELTAEESQTVKTLLSNPAVQQYFRLLHFNAQQDLLVNEVETPEQEQKLIARFKKFKGVQYLCTFIEANFRSNSL